MCNFAKKKHRTYRQAYGWTTLTHIRTHTHTLTHVAKAAWKKCQGIKSTCAFAMSCEIHRTHQRNNNNRITTTTTMEQQQQQRPHNGHRLSFCWKWATATSFAIGGTFLYSHILQHSAMQGRREREWGTRAEGRGGVFVCIFLKTPFAH